MSPSLNYLALQWAFSPSLEFPERREDYKLICDYFLAQCDVYVEDVANFVSSLDRIGEYSGQCLFDSLLSVCVDVGNSNIIDVMSTQTDILAFTPKRRLISLSSFLAMFDIVNGDLHPLCVRQCEINKIAVRSRRECEKELMFGKVPFLISRRKFDDSGVRIGVMVNHPMTAFFMAMYGK